ncbi:hypothetical protein MHYP_G00001100 [Metynnis hypsauchen]
MSARRAELKRKAEALGSAADGKKQKAEEKSGRREGRGGGGERAERAERQAGWLQLEVAELRARNAACKIQHQARAFPLREPGRFLRAAGGFSTGWRRDQRVQDNWAVVYAQQLALAEKLSLHVCFCLVPRYLDAAYRQYAFVIRGAAKGGQGM